MGCNGRVSDDGKLKRLSFYRKLKDGELYLAKNNDAVGNTNFEFIADEAFVLRELILKPFPRVDIMHGKERENTNCAVRDAVQKMRLENLRRFLGFFVQQLTWRHQKLTTS
ncbi:hypothetical protein PR048_028514 [Dryococelus australis]|uniref:DDE Tnp4 domain-containing protein n=1 Tax=Dryococelus australis TaxID=614101 RepID=A0ABQ9GB75_9NEOP|nr:hypothetical protein PR048_028514 [Dryococelus australis]